MTSEEKTHSDGKPEAWGFVEKNFSPLPELPAEPERAETPPQPVTWREMLAVLLSVVLADAAIFHCEGFAGIAAFLAGFAALLWFGVAKPRFSGFACLFGVMVFLTAAKLLWCGFVSTAVAGFVVLFLFGALQTSHRLRLLELVEYVFQTLCGGQGLEDYKNHLGRNFVRLPKGAWLSLFLPLAALLVFGTIFVMANPSLVELVQRGFRELGERFSRIAEWLPSWLQVVFWFGAAWIATGLIRPKPNMMEAIRRFFTTDMGDDATNSSAAKETNADGSPSDASSPYYGACRNTLYTVIVLFAVYLVFEFKTLWFQKFPEGFIYSEYCHRGAAWLVVALALSTVVLSLIFRRKMFQDSRIARLRKPAWIWSALNFVLAVGIYNRLYLYIDFNGMTRMRVVGLLGMTAVLIGFVMVVRKISEQRSFSWLIRRFTWTVLAMVFIDLVLPTDFLVHRYNVRRIMGGDLAPAVQISVHPCSEEGYLTFFPLARHCDDEIIREGVRAKMAEEYQSLSRFRGRTIFEGKYLWTKYQMARECLWRQIESDETLFSDYLEDYQLRTDAIKRFDEYVYRWY